MSTEDSEAGKPTKEYISKILKGAKMLKRIFILFFILQLFLASEAFACIRLMIFQEEHVIYASVALALWLFVWAIYYVIRGLLAYKNKNLEKQNPKTIYFLPALFYLVFILVFRLSLQNYTYFSYVYIGYALYVAYCCGYQVWAYTKQISPKKWAWICPIIPFYYVAISHTVHWLFKGLDLILDFYEIAFMLLCVIMIIYGICQFIEKQKESIKKIMWGLILVFTCIYSTYILYGLYALNAGNKALQGELKCYSHYTSIYGEA